MLAKFAVIIIWIGVWPSTILLSALWKSVSCWCDWRPKMTRHSICQRNYCTVSEKRVCVRACVCVWYWKCHTVICNTLSKHDWRMCQTIYHSYHELLNWKSKVTINSYKPSWDTKYSQEAQWLTIYSQHDCPDFVNNSSHYSTRKHNRKSSQINPTCRSLTLCTREFLSKTRSNCDKETLLFMFQCSSSSASQAIALK